MGEHIPKFKSEDEETAFWEKVSTSDLAPDFVEEVEVERPSKPLSSTFAIRLDQNSVRLLRLIAAEYSLGPTQLVRKWILERIKIEQSAGVLASRRTSFNPSLERILRKQVLEALMQQVSDITEHVLNEMDETVATDAISQADYEAWHDERVGDYSEEQEAIEA